MQFNVRPFHTSRIQTQSNLSTTRFEMAKEFTSGKNRLLNQRLLIKSFDGRINSRQEPVDKSWVNENEFELFNEQSWTVWNCLELYRANCLDKGAFLELCLLICGVELANSPNSPSCSKWLIEQIELEKLKNSRNVGFLRIEQFLTSRVAQAACLTALFAMAELHTLSSGGVLFQHCWINNEEWYVWLTRGDLVDTTWPYG